MQRRKSQRHVNAANARWRAERAQAERDAGIPDRTEPDDVREPVELDLRSYGGKRLRFEPRRGYIATRLIDADTGAVLKCAALKTLLHGIADALPRMLSPRNT